MTESAPAATEATPAEKREALKAAGFPVGSRGKLSADAEARYAELQSTASQN